MPSPPFFFPSKARTLKKLKNHLPSEKNFRKTGGAIHSRYGQVLFAPKSPAIRDNFYRLTEDYVLNKVLILFQPEDHFC